MNYTDKLKAKIIEVDFLEDANEKLMMIESSTMETMDMKENQYRMVLKHKTEDLKQILKSHYNIDVCMNSEFHIEFVETKNLYLIGEDGNINCEISLAYRSYNQPEIGFQVKDYFEGMLSGEVSMHKNFITSIPELAKTLRERI